MHVFPHCSLLQPTSVAAGGPADGVAPQVRCLPTGGTCRQPAAVGRRLVSARALTHFCSLLRTLGVADSSCGLSDTAPGGSASLPGHHPARRGEQGSAGAAMRPPLNPQTRSQTAQGAEWGRITVRRRSEGFSEMGTTQGRLRSARRSCARFWRAQQGPQMVSGPSRLSPHRATSWHAKPQQAARCSAVETP